MRVGRYAKTGRPLGKSNKDFKRLDTRAGDLGGRCPKCYLLYPADCTPGQCMARVNVWEQLNSIRLLMRALNGNVATTAKAKAKNSHDSMVKRERRQLAREQAEREAAAALSGRDAGP